MINGNGIPGLRNVGRIDGHIRAPKAPPLWMFHAAWLTPGGPATYFMFVTTSEGNDCKNDQNSNNRNDDPHPPDNVRVITIIGRGGLGPPGYSGSPRKGFSPCGQPATIWGILDHKHLVRDLILEWSLTFGGVDVTRYVLLDMG